MTRARVVMVAAVALVAGCVPPPAGEELPPWDARRADDAAVTQPLAASDADADADAEDDDAGVSERKARASALRLRVTGSAVYGAAAGSGFAIDGSTVVTNAHVVATGTEVAMTSWDGHDVDATATDTSVRHDLALLTTDEPVPVDPLELADDDPAEGDEVVVVGFPGGGRITVDDDAQVIGAADGGDYADTFVDTAVVPDTVVRLDAPSVRPGSSGGPVLDASGEVVGVVFAVVVADRGAGREALAIPVSTLRAWLAER